MGIALPDVPIPPEVGPVLRSLMYLFRMEHRRFWDVLAPLTAAQIDWRPRADADSIGMITDHVITAEQILIEANLLPEPVLPPASIPRSARLGRSGDERSGVDAGAYLADLAVRYERAMANMALLADEELREGRYWWWDGSESSLEEQLAHMIDHLPYHRGQIVYITLLDGFPAAGSANP
jgi:uncharacterized damage-inducible protein DinB